MSVQGKLDITIKISQMPNAEQVENGWKKFSVDCDGRVITMKVRPKVFKKLEEAQASYPEWVAAITGQMGQATATGFELENAAIQTFERKPKPPKATETEKPSTI